MLDSSTTMAGANMRRQALPEQRRTDRIFRWLIRPRRVLLLLAAIWVLNVFDLGYTLLESTQNHFVEMNPLAAGLIGEPTAMLVVYKASLVIIGSAVLLIFSRHSTTEWACWFLLAVYMYVGLRWCLYYAGLVAVVPGSLSAPLIPQ